MKNKLWLAPLLSVAVLAGCGGMKNKVPGTWTVDAATVKGSLIDKVRASNPGAFEAGLKKAAFKFNSDGTFTVSGAMGADQTGKWSLDGNKILMSVDNDKTPDQKPAMIINSEGTKIHLTQMTGDGSAEMDLIKSSS